MLIFRRQNLVAALCLLSIVCVHASILSAQASSSDRKKSEQAAALFREAYAVPETAPADQRRAAIKKFMSAAEIFHALKSSAEEANSLNAAANVHDDLGDKPEALHLYIQVADLLGDETRHLRE